MGKLTHTISSNLVSFKSADNSNIESLKIYFSPIQEGTGDPSINNIRNINGRTELTLDYRGKTLIEIAEGRYDWIIPQVFLGQTILYRGYINNTDGTKEAKLSFRFYDKNNSVLDTATSVQSVAVGDTGIVNVIIPLRTDAYSITFNVSTSSTAIVGKRYVILSSEVTLEDSYNEQTINISWENECGTLYGGYIDLITGTLVSDTVMFNLQGNEEYLTYQSSTGRLRIRNFDHDYGIPADLPISNVFRSSDTGDFAVNYATTTTGSKNLNLTFPAGYTEQNARDFIAQNNVQICCKVKSPIATYQLTPQQLKTLRGQNNLWSSANNNIEITYEFTDYMTKRRLELNTPHIETITGIMTTFNTDMKAALKECKVNFNPAQDRYATPSPTNVKTISGWTELQIQKNNDLIPIIPDNFTTGQLGTSNGVINYLGNNTYEFIGTVEDGGSIVIPITPITFIANTTYYVKAIKEPINGIGSADTALNIAFKNSNNKNIFVFRPNSAGWSNYTSGAYLTITENIEAVSLVIGIPAGSTSFKFRFFLSTSSSSITTINWASTLGTIPGGYLDLATGKLVQTHYKITFDGTEVISSTFAATGDNFIRIYFYSDKNSKILHAKRLANQHPETCAYSHGKYETSNTIDVSKGGAVINNSGTTTYIILHLPIELYVSDKLTTDIHNYLANQYNNGTPVEICYELNTPIEYQLTPQQIKTLKGINNIWSNANGAVDIKYWTH